MNYTFEDIAGYEDEKAELIRLCELFNSRKKYEAKGGRMPKGVIFYGEAGTGKTLFSKVMASACRLQIFKIDLGNVENESLVCTVIKKTFKKAEKCGKPSMVFFDELDKVLPDYREDYVTDRSKTILTQLLTLIDGMDSASNIVFVATCNYYNSLPETLVRPGRIDKKIGIGIPQYSSRVAILKMYAERTSCTFEMPMEELAKLANGFSCAALETLVNECVLQSDENGFVSRRLVQERFFEIKNEDIPRARSVADDTVRACRNIGSFVVARTINDGGYVLSLDAYTVCDDYFNRLLSEYDDDYKNFDIHEEDREIDEYYSDHDYDEDYDDDYDYDDDEDDEEDVSTTRFYSKKDMLDAITVRLGGYVAEEVILHKIYDNVQADLTLIDDILFSMSKCGMLGFKYRFSGVRNDRLFYSDAFADELFGVFDAIIEECYLKAKGITEKNEELIKNLISVLVEKQTLDEEKCKPVLERLGGVKK